MIFGEKGRTEGKSGMGGFGDVEARDAKLVTEEPELEIHHMLRGQDRTN